MHDALQSLTPEEREVVSQMIRDESLSLQGLSAAFEVMGEIKESGGSASLLDILGSKVELTSEQQRRIWVPPDVVSNKTQILARSPKED